MLENYIFKPSSWKIHAAVDCLYFFGFGKNSILFDLKFKKKI